MHTDIIEDDIQLATRAPPSLVCLPTIGVLIDLGIIGQAAGTDRVGRLDEADWQQGVAVDELGGWRAGGQNIQALVATQTKLDRHFGASVDVIKRRRVDDGEETVEIVEHTVADADTVTVTDVVAGRTGDTLDADAKCGERPA